jgi:hypothetical protein
MRSIERSCLTRIVLLDDATKILKAFFFFPGTCHSTHVQSWLGEIGARTVALIAVFPYEQGRRVVTLEVTHVYFFNF